MIYAERKFTLKNGRTVTLKTPEEKDAAEMLTLIKALCRYSPYLLSSPEDFGNDPEKERAFISSVRAGGNCFIAVYAEGQAIGDCNIDFFTHIKDRHRCSVGIALLPEFRGMGIGSLLFDEMIRLAREHKGTEQIELGVISENTAAIRLYESKGFEKTGVIPRAIRDQDGTFHDEIIMVKIL